MVRVSSPAKLRPWSELTAKMVMGVVPGLVNTGESIITVSYLIFGGNLLRLQSELLAIGPVQFR